MAYFTTLYSGSSGNCALIRSDDKYLLIDMGKSCRTTLTALKSLGLAVSDCVGILVTHEHSDHVSGLDTFLKKHPVPLYGCADTLDTLASRGTIPPAVEAIPVDGQTLEIGSFTVTSFPTSHDVPCCGYRIRTPEGRVMAFATDLGYLTPVVQDNLMGCDLVALEAIPEVQQADMIFAVGGGRAVDTAKIAAEHQVVRSSGRRLEHREIEQNHFAFQVGQLAHFLGKFRGKAAV